MIVLYRAAGCPRADRVQEQLEDLVVAHRVVVLPEIEGLPAIEDGRQRVSGRQPLEEYLGRLEKTVADWNRFQGDACYLDDDGEVC